MNPNNPIQLNRLGRAIEWSRRRLQPFRVHRMDMLRNFVGAHYSWSGSNQRIPLNLLQLAHNIYLRQLVSKAPAAMTSPYDPQVKPAAKDFESWCDKATVGMRLHDSLTTFVSNGLWSLGTMKVGECHVGEVTVGSTIELYGQPFAEPVDLDDWVHDITAKRYDQVQYAGNRYRVSLEEAKSNPLFDPKARDQLQIQTKYAYNEMGDPRTMTLSQSTLQFYDEYADHVEIWDIFLPKEQLLVTMPYQESVTGGFSNALPLRVVQWEGHREGPYVLLSYSQVPDNVMPSAPMQHLVDLHELINLMWRKLARQAGRQKEILGVMGSASDDVERINRTDDGHAVRVDMPDRIKVLAYGGMKPENLAAVMQAKELLVYMAGNLDSIGGLSPQATTFHGDELLNQNASAQLAEMQDRTVNATREIYERLGKLWWTNPILSYTAQRSVGAGVDVPVELTPQMRQIPWESLGFTIDPYSMQNSTPQKKLTAIMQILQTVLIPLAPQMAQQGINVKWPAVLDLVEKYGDLPELADILEVGPPPQMQGPMQLAQQAAQGAPEQPPQSPVTSRTNIRENRPMRTNDGMAKVMQLMAMGQPQRQAG